MIRFLKPFGALLLVLAPIFYLGFIAKPSIRVAPTGVSNRDEAQMDDGVRLWQEYVVRGNTNALLLYQLGQCATDAGLVCKTVDRHTSGTLYLHIYGASGQSLYINKKEVKLTMPGDIKHPEMDDAFREFGKCLQKYLPDD